MNNGEKKKKNDTIFRGQTGYYEFLLLPNWPVGDTDTEMTLKTQMTLKNKKTDRLTTRSGAQNSSMRGVDSTEGQQSLATPTNTIHLTCDQL